jgi:hypothetical protein
MAVNIPVADNARKGAVKKRTYQTGEFMAVKKSQKKFRKEH